MKNDFEIHTESTPDASLLPLRLRFAQLNRLSYEVNPFQNLHRLRQPAIPLVLRLAFT
jgi:hypothetical protein